MYNLSAAVELLPAEMGTKEQNEFDNFFESFIHI